MKKVLEFVSAWTCRIIKHSSGVKVPEKAKQNQGKRLGGKGPQERSVPRMVAPSQLLSGPALSRSSPVTLLGEWEHVSGICPNHLQLDTYISRFRFV